MNEEKNFWEWYNETSKTAGSLVTPASAGKMLGTTRQYIEKLATAGRLKKYYFDDLPFIGLNDINAEMIRRKLKIEKENDARKLLKKAQKEQLLDEIKKLQDKKRLDKELSEEIPDDIMLNEEIALDEEIEFLEQQKMLEESSDEITDFDPDKYRENEEKI